MVTKRGKNGGTFAHWQISIAYAKYLSHEFQMWCNQVVRSHMEGGVQQLPVDVLEHIERTDGIVRMLAKKITHIEHTLPLALAAMTEAAIAAHMSKEFLHMRRGQTAKQIWDSAGLPPKLRGATLWLGNRLSEMGCTVLRADAGNSTIRIFDPDKASVCMKNGLRHKARVYANERMGQGKLKLIGGAK